MTIITEARYGLDDLPDEVAVSFFNCPACKHEVMAAYPPGTVIEDLECDTPVHAFRPAEVRLLQ